MVWRGARGWAGGVVMTTRLLRGVGTARAKGKGERACDELTACVSSGAGVRACVRTGVRVRPRATERGWGHGGVLWSVRCEVTMQSPVRVWEGGRVIMGCLPPLCVCEVVS